MIGTVADASTLDRQFSLRGGNYNPAAGRGRTGGDVSLTPPFALSSRAFGSAARPALASNGREESAVSW